jgi:hypothetical protein
MPLVTMPTVSVAMSVKVRSTFRRMSALIVLVVDKAVARRDGRGSPVDTVPTAVCAQQRLGERRR